MQKETQQKSNAKQTALPKISIEDLAVFCKKKGFVYPSSEIYGYISGFWDFGPVGVELFTNIKSDFWKFFVHTRSNMVGMEASIISHPRTWKASGHIESFGDLVIVCSKCSERLRADHYIQEKLGMNVEGKPVAEINKIIKDNNIKCPKCKHDFEELKKFNLLFETRVGAAGDKSNIAYLRGETAQGMFLDFKTIVDTNRVKLPFGMLQIGRCFRNEIAPRDFLFRSREFTIAEFEFFIHPDEKKCNILAKEQLNLKVPLLSAETQNKGSEKMEIVTIKEMLDKKKLDEWHAYWLAEQIRWMLELGLKSENLKVREHTKTELSHYSSATFDIDYAYPFGSKEVAGNANRGQYDLNQQIKESGKELFIFNQDTKERIIPRVIEPTFGMERVFLAVLCEAYDDDKKRGNIVLHLSPKIAPIKAAVFPLLSNREELTKKAEGIYKDLKQELNCFYDDGGSIGRRYARQDELGTPYCITVDFDSLNDSTVTIRERDSTAQKRVKAKDLPVIIDCLIKGKMLFKNI